MKVLSPPTSALTPESGKLPPLVAPSCGCAVQGLLEAGQAVGEIDALANARTVKRLRRIEGQVRGLQKMVDEDRYCADIMTQISSVHEALRAVSREVMRSHILHCTSAAARTGNADADPMYDELIEMMYRLAR